MNVVSADSPAMKKPHASAGFHHSQRWRISSDSPTMQPPITYSRNISTCAAIAMAVFAERIFSYLRENASGTRSVCVSSISRSPPTTSRTR